MQLGSWPSVLACVSPRVVSGKGAKGNVELSMDGAFVVLLCIYILLIFQVYLTLLYPTDVLAKPYRNVSMTALISSLETHR